MNLHDIENDNTTHEDLASLGGYQPKYKIHTGSNTNAIMLLWHHMKTHGGEII